MDSDGRKIKQKIAELLDEPILPPRLNLDSCRFRTPSVHYRSKPSCDRNRPGIASRPYLHVLDPRREELCRVLERGLGHFAANPSRPGNVSALKALYTFPESEETPPLSHWYGGVLTPNKDEQSVREFVLQLADLAQDNRALCEDRYYGRGAEERDLSTDRVTLASRSKWTLVGDRGVGKTIFLNYAFTAFNELLHEKKVIWIRIDYTKDKPKPVKLTDWIRWKICRVLFHWYDAQSRKTDAEKMGRHHPNWQHWKEKTDKDMVFNLGPDSDILYDRARLEDPHITREEFEREVRHTRVKILSQGKPSKVNLWVFQAIWHHLVVDHKVGFIIIVDGLDRLGLTDRDKERFERKVKEVQSAIRTEKALPAAYVVCARYESYCLHLVEEQLKKFRLARVQPVSAEAIWEKKRAYLQDQKILPPERFEHVHSMGQRQYQATQDLLCDSLIAFATYALTSTWSDMEPTDDSSIGFALLEDIFGQNIRLLFDALAASARFLMATLPESFDALLDSAMATREAEWLEKEGDVTLTTRRDIERGYRRWYYRFIEALMLQSPGNEFRRDRYRYALKRGYGEAAEFHCESVWPDEYLPNVFRHVWGETVVSRPCVLATLRAMQYARCCANVANRNDLIHFLESHFEYSGNVLRLTIDQLVEAGIFRPYIGECISPAELVLTHRGEFVLDRLVHALEYLCLALQTAPLPHQLVQENLFPVRPYTSESFVIDNKIVSTVNFMRLLSDLEDVEEEYFNKHVNEQLMNEETRYDFRAFKDRSFRITDILKESTQTAMNRMVDRAFNQQDKQQIAQLKERFLSHPEEYFGTA